MSERMLPEVVSLRHPDDPEHPVWDLERLCRVVLDGQVRATSRDPEPADYEEALGFLLGEGVILTRRYDPARGSVPFPAWLEGQLRFRLLDHWRAPYGTRREVRLGSQRLAELDRPALGGDGHTLGDALAEREGFGDDDRGEALGGLDAPRDRRVLREVAGLGLGAGRRAEDGAPDRGQRADVDLSGRPWLDCGGCGWRTYRQAPNGRPGWHMPDECVGCGAALGRPSVAA